MINWNRLTLEELKDMADWAIRMNFYYLAKVLIEDIEIKKLKNR
jgi:hypothetical protein